MIQKKSTLESMLELDQWKLLIIGIAIKAGDAEFEGDNISMAQWHCEEHIKFIGTQLAIYEIGIWECEVLFGCAETSEIVTISQGDSSEFNEGDEDVFFYISSVDELYELQNPNCKADFILLSIK